MDVYQALLTSRQPKIILDQNIWRDQIPKESNPWFAKIEQGQTRTQKLYVVNGMLHVVNGLISSHN